MHSSPALPEPLTPQPPQRGSTTLALSPANGGVSADTRLVSAGFAVAFLAVCVAGLAQALAASPQAFPRDRLGLIVSLSAAYALSGTLGLSLLERRGTSARALRFSLIGLALLAGAATLLSHGYAAMLLLALVSTSVLLLSFRASVLVSLGAGLLALIAFMGRNSVWSALLQAEMAFGSGIAFVFVFSRIALRERAARAELERMAQALTDANAALAEHAARVEQLATSAERSRIAREIHDGLGHYLTVVHVQLEAALSLLATDAERARAAIGKAQGLTRQGLDEVRRSVALLREGAEPHRDLVQTLRALAHESSQAGLPTQLELTGAQRHVPEPIEFTLYRTAQEALTNARRHARASHAQVRLRFAPDELQLSVEDDGVGSATLVPGFGLRGLRERAELIGAELRIDSKPQQGFRLELSVRA